MPFGTISLKPGLVTQYSPAQLRQGWSAGNMVRFRDGMPEKRGGWQQLTADTLVGTATGMHAWADLQGNNYLIAGTEQRVQIYSNGSIYDVTPIRKTKNPAAFFSTMSGNRSVTAKVGNHSVDTLDWFYLATQISVGGLLLHGYYQVDTFVNQDNFTFLAASPAGSTVVGGGVVPIFTVVANSTTVSVFLPNHGFSAGDIFQIDVPTMVGGLNLAGPVSIISAGPNTFAFTWGVPASFNDNEHMNGGDAQFWFFLTHGYSINTLIGGYGAGIYGSGIYGEQNAPSFPIKLRSWFWDNWGQDGIGNPYLGGLYLWVPLVSGTSRCTLIDNAPDSIGSSFVAMPQRIVVALGSSNSGVFDPCLVSWSNANDYTDWTPTVINQAGSFRLPTGSRIVGGMQAPLQGLVWTDVDLYVMQYINLPFIFGFSKIANGCGLIAPKAAGLIGNTIIWMGPQGFFIYAGGQVQPLECPVWHTVYRNLTPGQAEQIFCAVNEGFSEIQWYYPSDNQPDPTNPKVDSYVTYNVLEGTWDYGLLARSAWVGQSPLGTPIGADYDGLLQQHEVGFSANGAPIDSFISSGYEDLTNGHDFIFMDEIIPDMIATPVYPASPQLALTGYATPNDANPKAYGPYPIDGSIGYVSTRFRGRLAQMTISDNSTGFWRLGLIRYRYAPDGSR